MTQIKLDTLPKELISLIASQGDARAVLKLSETSKTLRAACYDGLVFRDIILISQNSNWQTSSLELDAIAAASGKRASSWARYAIADQKAWELKHAEKPLEDRQRFSQWLPELSAAKHPFLSEDCWRDARRSTDDSWPAKQIFSLLMAVLQNPKPMRELEASFWKRPEKSFIDPGVDLTAFYWEFCATVFTLRQTLRNSHAVWPYNDFACRPHIGLPTMQTIPLSPANSNYNIPIPFMDTWDEWHTRHSAEMADSPSCLLGTEWVGYYLHGGAWRQQLRNIDPPMVNIKFHKFDGEAHRAPEQLREIHLLAERCQDGLASFEIEGWLSYTEGACTFTGVKRYAMTFPGNRDGTWHWLLRLTPLGLFGFWGNDTLHGFERSGTVWLWKKEWTA